MAPAHTPLSPSPKPIELPVLPIELQDLLDSVTRRLIDLETYQIPQLSSCKGPLSLHEQIANGIRIEIVGIKRDLEELKLLVDDLDRAKDKRAGEFEIVGINSRLISLTKAYREAVLVSKRIIDSSVHLSARDELFLNASKSGGTSRIVAESAVSPDDALMNATSDVTEGLRRTMQLMQQELDRSLISNEILESSTATMQMTSDQYSTFSTLLSTSKALITSLERADFLDRLILLFAVIFFLLCCAYVFKRRVVDKGIRVAGALSRVVAGSNKASTPSFNNDDWDSLDDYGAGDVFQSVVAGTATLAAVVEAVTQRRRGRMREIKIAEAEPVAAVKPVAIVESVLPTDTIATVEPVAIIELVEDPAVSAASIPIVEIIPSVVEEVEVVEPVLKDAVPPVEPPVLVVESLPVVLEVPGVVEETILPIPETIFEIPVFENSIIPVTESPSPISKAPVNLESVTSISEASAEPTIVVKGSTLLEDDSPTPLVQIELFDVPDLLQKPLEYSTIPEPVGDLVAATVEEVVVPVIEESVIVPLVNEVVLPFIGEAVVPVIKESAPLVGEILAPIAAEIVAPVIAEAITLVKSEIFESSLEISTPEPTSTVVPHDVEAMISLLRNGATPSASPHSELPSPDNLFPGYGADELTSQIVQEVRSDDQHILGDNILPLAASVTSIPVVAVLSPSPTLVVAFAVESILSSISTPPVDNPYSPDPVTIVPDLDQVTQINPSLAGSLPSESMVVEQVPLETTASDTYSTISSLPYSSTHTAAVDVSFIPPPLPTISTIIEIPIAVVLPTATIPSTLIEVPSAAPAIPLVEAVPESTPIPSIPSPEIPVVSTSLASIVDSEPISRASQEESIHTPIEVTFTSTPFATTTVSVSADMASVYSQSAPQEVGIELTPVNFIVDSSTTTDSHISSRAIPVESIPTNSVERILPSHSVVKPYSHFGVVPLEVVNELPPNSSLPVEQAFATIEFTPPIASPPFATPDIIHSATPLPLTPPLDPPTLDIKEVTFSSISSETQSIPPVAEPAKSEPIVFLEPTLSSPELTLAISTVPVGAVTPIPDTLVAAQDELTLPLVELEATPSMYTAETASTWGYHTFNPDVPTPTHLSEEVQLPREFGNVEGKTSEELVVPSTISLHNTVHEVASGESELPHGAEIVDVQVEYFQVIDGVQKKFEIVEGEEVVVVEEDKVIGLNGTGATADTISAPVELPSTINALPFNQAEAIHQPPTILAEKLPVESAAPGIKRSVVAFSSPEVLSAGASDSLADIEAAKVQAHLPEWMKVAQADMFVEKEAGAVTISEVDLGSTESVVEGVVEIAEDGSSYIIYKANEVEEVGAKEEAVVVEEVDDLEGEEWNRMLDERRALQAIEERRLVQTVQEPDSLNVAPIVVRDEL